MAKKLRIYYETSAGKWCSSDYPFVDFEQAQKLVSDFERENDAKVIDVSYFPSWHPGITCGYRLAFQLQLFPPGDEL